MSGRFRTSLAILWIVVLCLLQSPGALAAPILTSAANVTPYGQPDVTSSYSGRILVVMGLREEANLLVRIAVLEEFDGLDVQLVHADDAASPDYHWPDADLYLAAGSRSCHLVLESLAKRKVLCTLLTEESFLGLDADQYDNAQIAALVIDQPVDRQARVANVTYPSLSRFSVFSSANQLDDIREDSIAVDGFPYFSSVSLPSQLSDALHAHDALIATSDNSIFNASTLSTVLLTAYGYHKPVIGFSRAYVKAGALISSFSTPSQIFREIAHWLRSGATSFDDMPPISYPRYFSVIVNASVARSLGLIQSRRFNYGETLTDEDFEP